MEKTNVVIYPVGWLFILCVITMVALFSYIFGMVKGWNIRNKELKTDFDFESNKSSTIS